MLANTLSEADPALLRVALTKSSPELLAIALQGATNENLKMALGKRSSDAGLNKMTRINVVKLALFACNTDGKEGLTWSELQISEVS